MRLEDQFYKPSEVAKLLRVTPYTIKRWLKKGEVRGDKINSRGDWRIPVDEVRRLLKMEGSD